MTDKKSNDSRRKLLKSLAAGSGAVVAGKTLPESWAKPVVDAVLLPAHAETTDESGDLSTDTTTLPPSPVRLENNTFPNFLCSERACEKDKASEHIYLYNTSSSSVSVTGVVSSKSSHSIEPTTFSIDPMSSSCGFFIIDSSPTTAECPGEVSGGTVSVQVAGYADLEIQVPLP